MSTEKITEGQETVMLFDIWQEMLISGKIPDCKRYHDDFFTFYKDIIKDEKAPFYLMFCAFVGAIDVINYKCCYMEENNA